MSFWVCADKTPCGDAANTSATRATAQQLMAPGADQLKELVSPIKLFFGPRISHVLRIGRKRGTRAPPRANQKLDTGSLSRTGPYNRPGKSSSRPLDSPQMPGGRPWLWVPWVFLFLEQGCRFGVPAGCRFGLRAAPGWHGGHGGPPTPPCVGLCHRPAWRGE